MKKENCFSRIQKIIACVVVMFFTTTTVLTQPALCAVQPIDIVQDECLASLMQHGKVSDTVEDVAAFLTGDSFTATGNDAEVYVPGEGVRVISVAQVDDGGAIQKTPSSSTNENAAGFTQEIVDATSKEDAGESAKDSTEKRAGIIKTIKGFFAFLFVSLFLFVSNVKGYSQEVMKDFQGKKETPDLMADSSQVGKTVSQTLALDGPTLDGDPNDGLPLDTIPVAERQKMEQSRSMVNALVYASYVVSNRADRIIMAEQGLVELVEPHAMRNADVQRIGTVLFASDAFAGIVAQLQTDLGLESADSLKNYLLNYDRYSVSEKGGEEKVASDFRAIYAAVHADKARGAQVVRNIVEYASLLASDKKATYNARGTYQPQQLDFSGLQIPRLFTEEQAEYLLKPLVDKFNSKTSAVLRGSIFKVFGNDRGVRIKVTTDDVDQGMRLQSLGGTQHVSYEGMLHTAGYVDAQVGQTITNKYGSTVVMEEYLPGQRRPGNVMAKSRITMDSGETFTGIAFNLGWFQNEAEHSWRFTNAIYTLLQTSPDMRALVSSFDDIWVSAVDAMESNPTTVRAWVNTWYRTKRAAEHAAGNTAYNARSFGKDVSKAFNKILSNPYNTQNKANEFSMPVGGLYVVMYEYVIEEDPTAEFVPVLDMEEIVVDMLKTGDIVEKEIGITNATPTFLQFTEPVLSPERVEQMLQDAADNTAQVSNSANDPVNTKLVEPASIYNYGEKGWRLDVESTNLTRFGDFSVRLGEFSRSAQQTDISGVWTRYQDGQPEGIYTDYRSAFNKNTIDYKTTFAGWIVNSWGVGFETSTFSEKDLRDAQFGRRMTFDSHRDFLDSLSRSEHEQKFAALVLSKDFASKFPLGNITMRVGKETNSFGEYVLVLPDGSMGQYMGDSLSTFTEQMNYANGAFADSLDFTTTSGGRLSAVFTTKQLRLPLGFETGGAVEIIRAGGETDARYYVGVQRARDKTFDLGADYLFDKSNNRLNVWMGINSGNVNFSPLARNSGPMDFMPSFSPYNRGHGSLWAAVKYSKENYDRRITQSTEEVGGYVGWKWLAASAEAGRRDIGNSYMRFGLSGNVYLGKHIVATASIMMNGQHNTPDFSGIQFDKSGLTTGFGLSFILGNKDRKGKKGKQRPHFIETGDQIVLPVLFTEIAPGVGNVSADRVSKKELKYKDMLDGLAVADSTTFIDLKPEGYGQQNDFFEEWNKAVIDVQANLDSTITSRQQVKYIAELVMNENQLPAALDAAGNKLQNKSVVTTVTAGDDGKAYTIIAVYDADGRVKVEVAEDGALDRAGLDSLITDMRVEYASLVNAITESGDIPAETFATDSVSIENMSAIETDLIENYTDSIAAIMTEYDTNAVYFTMPAQDSSFYAVSFIRTADSSFVNVKVGTINDVRAFYDVGTAISENDFVFQDVRSDSIVSALDTITVELKPYLDGMKGQAASAEAGALLLLNNAVESLREAGFRMATDSISVAEYEQMVAMFRAAKRDSIVTIKDNQEIMDALNFVESELTQNQDFVKDLSARIQETLRVRADHDFSQPLTVTYATEDGVVTVVLQKGAESGTVRVSVSFEQTNREAVDAAADLDANSPVQKGSVSALMILALLLGGLRARGTVVTEEMESILSLLETVTLVRRDGNAVLLHPAVVPVLILAAQVGVARAVANALFVDAQLNIAERESLVDMLTDEAFLQAIEGMKEDGADEASIQEVVATEINGTKLGAYTVSVLEDRKNMQELATVENAIETLAQKIFAAETIIVVKEAASFEKFVGRDIDGATPVNDVEDSIVKKLHSTGQHAVVIDAKNVTEARKMIKSLGYQDVPAQNIIFLNTKEVAYEHVGDGNYEHVYRAGVFGRVKTSPRIELPYVDYTNWNTTQALAYGAEANFFTAQLVPEKLSDLISSLVPTLKTEAVIQASKAQKALVVDVEVDDTFGDGADTEAAPAAPVSAMNVNRDRLFVKAA